MNPDQDIAQVPHYAVPKVTVTDPHNDPDESRLICWITTGMARRWFEEFETEHYEDPADRRAWQDLSSNEKELYFSFIAGHVGVPVENLELFIDALE